MRFGVERFGPRVEQDVAGKLALGPFIGIHCMLGLVNGGQNQGAL